MIASILLQDGKANEGTFEMMQEEGAFPRLVELIQLHGKSGDMELHRLLLELMYEMSRIQTLTWEDLSTLFSLLAPGDDANHCMQLPLTMPSSTRSSKSSNPSPSTLAIPTTTP